MKRKSIKKAGVAVLSMALLMSMGAMAMPVNATAGDAKRLQIPNVTCGTSTMAVTDAKVYKVAEQDASTGRWAWVGTFANKADVTTLNTLTSVELNTLARELQSKASKATPVTVTTVGNNADALEQVLDITGKAYYLVIPTLDTNEVIVQPSLVEIDANGDAFTEIKAKANPLPLEKKITATTAGEVSASGDTSVGVIGSTVKYKISSYLPNYADDVTNVKPYILTDDPSDGIKINNDDFTAAGSNVVVKIDGTVDTTAAIAKADDGFTVTVPSATVIANKGKAIEVTFQAEIDTDAVLGAGTALADHQDFNGNPNTVKLTWGNNYTTGNYAYPTDHTPSPEYPDEPEIPDTPQVEKKDTVTTYAGKVNLLKQGDKDGDSVMENLAGAEFTLAGDNGTTATGLKSDVNGVIDFGYLAAGTYTLTETKAPSGYKTIGSTYQFTVKTMEATSQEFTTYEVDEAAAATEVQMTYVNSNKADANIVVTDPPADTLPATGGIGTYVFTFGGAAIILLAGVLFVIYMKKRKAED
ncbi:MAG: isopeptide-forming domain-containing fimbrial protein [Clostridia bacterium]|nr:isopeptide-forming domain-containing fimbrial protein [Clostridia bacterium]